MDSLDQLKESAMFDQKECDLYFETLYQFQEEVDDNDLELTILDWDYSDEIEEIKEIWGQAC
jgi:hypothetical protein